MRRGGRVGSLLLAAALCCGTAVAARAQGPGGPGGGEHGPQMGGPGGPPGFGNGPPRDGFPPHRNGGPPPDAGHGDVVSTLHGGLQLGPPGRWWDDKHFAEDLRLSPDQRKRMDAIFSDNRSNLLARFRTLREEEGRMEALTHNASPNEDALFAQIDRLTEARAGVEKAYTHMLLSIRHEMSADQLARLDSHR